MRFVTPHSRLFGARTGFTMVEILVAATITIVLVGILLNISTLTSNAVKQSSATLTAFSTARTAFDTMTQKLSQATLNPYLDYYGTVGTTLERRTPTNALSFRPVAYGRVSDLQFYIRSNVENSGYGQEVYFQAPEAYSVAKPAGTSQVSNNLQDVQGLLNACGFYVAFGSSTNFQPTGVATLRYRYRLMQAMEPTEKFNVFVADTQNAFNGAVTDSATAWITNIQNTAAGPTSKSVYVSPLADNVIALVVWPRVSIESDPTGTSLSTDYTYDSQKSVAPTLGGSGLYTQSSTADELPPTVQVTMFVMDEASAVRLASQGTAGTAPTVIQTALLNRFKTVSQYATDVSAVASSLSLAHINFQIFDQTIPLRESRWSNATP